MTDSLTQLHIAHFKKNMDSIARLISSIEETCPFYADQMREARDQILVGHESLSSEELATLVSGILTMLNLLAARLSELEVLKSLIADPENVSDDQLDQMIHSDKLIGAPSILCEELVDISESRKSLA